MIWSHLPYQSFITYLNLGKLLNLPELISKDSNVREMMRELILMTIILAEENTS